MDWHLGTVGFGYKQWNGIFYPKGMKPIQYLRHYATYFNSVEIDSTFYGTPGADKVIRWESAVPDRFRFAVKTPQQITHEMRLVNAAEEMERFVDTMRHLKEKLGIVLIQLPPDFTSKEEESLAAFLPKLPADVRFAVEFRHLSWMRPHTQTLLARFNVTQVSADYVILPKRLLITSDILYFRFLGRHGRYQTKDKELRDPTSDLQMWVKQLEAVDQSPLSAAYGFFNNDFAGYSPESCHKFRQLLGIESDLPSFAVQGRLF